MLESGIPITVFTVVFVFCVIQVLSAENGACANTALAADKGYKIFVVNLLL